jgi:hypothetical protein
MLTVKVLRDFQQDIAASAFEVDRGSGRIEMVRAGNGYYEAGAEGRIEVKSIDYIHIIGFDSWLSPLKGNAGLGQGGTGIAGRGMPGEFDDIEVEEGRGLVPDDMVDGFIAVGDVFDIARVDGRYDGFDTDYLNPEGRMGEEDDYGVCGMDMRGGGIVHRNLAFQQPEVRVFLDDLVVGFPADGELGLPASGKQ